MRFLLAYSLLAAVLGAAAVAFVVLLARPEPAPSPTQATPDVGQFRPTARGLGAATQIAEFVARRYRLPNGKQLVAVQAGPLVLEETRIPAIAIRDPSEAGSDEISVVPGEDTVVYVLCGLGKNCAIPDGKPSTARFRLVRREALELALYTFAYLENVQSVVAFLPPASGSPASYVVFFQRGDLDGALDKPAQEDLLLGTPPLADAITPAEAMTIDRLTAPRVFQFAFQQLQDGRPILVLQPMEATSG